MIPATIGCPRCHKGHIKQKVGRYGVFFGCSNFPACRFTCTYSDVCNMIDPPNFDEEFELYGEAPF